MEPKTGGLEDDFPFHIHPCKLIWNPKNGGLEDDFPFQTGDFQVPCQFSRVSVYSLHLMAVSFHVRCGFPGKHQQEPYELDADGCDQGMRPCEAIEPFGPNSCEKLGSTNIRWMEEIQLISWYGKYPIIYRVLYMLGGAGFLPSTVAGWKTDCPSGCCNTLRAHPRQSPVRQLWKKSLFSPLGKVARGVFQRCVETTFEDPQWVDAFPIQKWGYCM